MERLPFLLTALDPPLGEKLIIGAEVALMGLAIVFFVLSVIWGVLELFRILFYDIPMKKKEKLAKASNVEIAEKQENDLDLQNVQAEAEDEGEILAAITAAIAIATEKQPGTFRVVSFKRVSKK